MSTPGKLLAAALVAGMGCGKDAAGPGAQYPPLPQAILTSFCIRGNRTLGDTAASHLSDADCDDGNSYYEIWRVRVPQDRPVTFDDLCGFDNVLDIVRLDSLEADTIHFTWVGGGDDRGLCRNPNDPGCNALVTVTLIANQDYFAVVEGYSYGQVGYYTLKLR